MTIQECVWRVLGLPTQPEKVARGAFSLLHPDRCVAWTTLAAEEDERFVVGIFYGDTRPPSYAFYAVSKQTGEATSLDDDSAYRPQTWR